MRQAYRRPHRVLHARKKEGGDELGYVLLWLAVVGVVVSYLFVIL